jgi:putative SOS response-associated peptidase YedK
LGNLAPLPEVYPDRLAPIVRNTAEGRELAMARWGLPTPPVFLKGKKTDREAFPGHVRALVTEEGAGALDTQMGA